MTYTNWAKYQPSSNLNENYCIDMTLDGQGEWKSENCMRKKWFVCQKSSIYLPQNDLNIEKIIQNLEAKYDAKINELIKQLETNKKELKENYGKKFRESL
jgi:Lectin C-type domain